MPTIYRVKIKQPGAAYLKNNPKRVFPFDNVYLVHKSNSELIPRLFKYSLVMPLNQGLHTALNKQRYDYHERITRKNLEREPLVKITDSPFEKFEEWFVVVPTHVVADKDSSKRDIHKDRVYYIGSEILKKLNGIPYGLPSIQLQTPKRRYALLCLCCSHLAETYTGECKYGTPGCLQQRRVTLSKDGNIRAPKELSMQEGGETQ